LGKLRQKLVELDEEDGIWTEISAAAFSPRLARPNRFQNHIQFKEWWATSKLAHGNTYTLKERDGRQGVGAMYILDPTRVTPLIAPDGAIFYDLKADNLAGLQMDSVAVPASEIIHDRMNCIFHPLVGVSPIWSCGSAANMGLEIATNSATFFGNGSNPSGILTSPTPITPEKSKELSEIWNSRFGGQGSGGVAVLGNAMKFEPMRMSAVDSELVGQLDWVSAAICTAFHVPPFKVGIGAMPSSENAERLNQIYYSDCLQSHIEQYEACMDEMFGFESPVGGKTYGVELDLDGLLRMDTASQVTTLTEAIGGSLYSIDEARQKIDRKKVQGGDKIWMQQQNFSLEALDQRDQNDPFAKAPTAPAVAAADATPALPAPETQKLLPEKSSARAIAAILSIGASTLEMQAA
jgi:HK97 family phage portal protein